MATSQQSSKKRYEVSETPFQLVSKRLFDIVISAICLLVILPVLLVIAIGILLEDGRPVFFKQKRSGRRDSVFFIYKFRSMVKDPISGAGGTKESYTWENGVPDDFVFKSSSLDNPNITKIGYFIRKYSLDELPQFFNVLKGDMSLVGPRPEIIEITRCYNDEQRSRLAMKPGITGWAQVNGRSINHGEKIKYDLDYVRHFSLRFDMKIMLYTVISVFRGDDAV